MKYKFVILSIVLSLVGVVSLSPQAALAGASDRIMDGVNSVGGGNEPDLESSVTNVINTMLFIVGIASIIVIILSGIYFVTSAGNAETVKKAKNALIYSIVGLVITILAYAIVNFVIGIF